jgi:hypothetical protein
MKTPFKISWAPFWQSTIAGTAFCVLFYLILGPLGLHQPFSLVMAFQLFCVLGVYGVFGFLLSTINSPRNNIFHRMVISQINPEELVKGQVYWLNGETHATYLDWDSFSGQYLFHIYGLNNPKDPGSGTLVLPGNVRLFISSICEDPSQPDFLKK